MRGYMPIIKIGWIKGIQACRVRQAIVSSHMDQTILVTLNPKTAITNFASGCFMSNTIRVLRTATKPKAHQNFRRGFSINADSRVKTRGPKQNVVHIPNMPN